jgi:quinol monooxygenase YgiN
MLTLEIEVTCNPKQRNDMLSLLRTIVGPLSAEPACAGCQSYEALEPGTLLLTSQWHTQSELNGYIASDAFRQTLEWMELSTQTPRIHVSAVLDPSAMEVISFIREKKLATRAMPEARAGRR